MQKKILLATFLVVALGLGVLLSAFQVAAQGPTNSNPGSAVYIDNQWHSIPPQTSLWYVFDYSGDQSKIDLLMTDGTINRLAFNVYTPDRVRPLDQFLGAPIGRGSSARHICDDGWCLSNDLNWGGSFTGGGTFYVEVSNFSQDAKPFRLIITGSGVTLRSTPTLTPTVTKTATPTLSATVTPTTTVVVTLTSVLMTTTVTPTAPLSATVTATVVATPTITLTTTTTATPTATLSATVTPTTVMVTPTITLTTTAALTPTTVLTTTTALTGTGLITTTATSVPASALGSTSTSVATNLYPWDAIYVQDYRTRIIPGASSLWFKFDYVGDRTPVIIRLPSGYKIHVRFYIYTQDRATRVYQDGDFIGAGTPPLTDCFTSRCPSDDLLWSGGFGERGTFYIRVTNEESAWKSFQLQVSGPGAILGR